MQIVKIKGCIKSYAWGSRDILPSLFHYKSDGSPQAEAWFGIHPDGCSRLENGQALDAWLEEDPLARCGNMEARVPIMMKFLAVNTPLSLHVHPNRTQAILGWQNEEVLRRLGRNEETDYRDQNAKSELFCASTPSTLLCGFRDHESASWHLKRLLGPLYDELFAHSRTVRGLVKTLFSLEGEKLKAVVDACLRSMDEAGEELSRGGVYLTERGISEKIFSIFGHEPSVVMPYLMNVIHMRIGEAIYIRSGVLHTYVHGSGIEIEDCSDNECRIGMSEKHVNVASALNLIDFDAHFNGKLELYTDPFLRLVADGPDWSLAIMKSGSYDIKETHASFILCTEGQARVGTRDGHVTLKEGECAFIPSCDDEYHVRVGGRVCQAICGRRGPDGLRCD